MITVEIITIGDELLIGQVIDTNSAWMAQQLNKTGLDVRFKTTIGDNESDILDAVERAFSRASVVLLTGGIGPTKDDITKKTLCRFFNTELVFDETTLKNVEEVVRSINRSLNELTRNQAYVPENCTVIQNKMGTAPVTWFEKEGKILVSMPGVPFEMKWIMQEEVIPRIQAYFHPADSIRFRTFWVNNYSESLLAMHLESFENELPEFIRLAYLPASGLIRLRLTGKYPDETVLSAQMAAQRVKLLALLPGDIISEEEDSIEILLNNLLIDKGLTLSIAESCTGGKIASLLTAIPGCSRYFKGSIVSYSNESKEKILKVNSSDITNYGAVSKVVVEQMSQHCQILFDSDCSIATSGIAGPDGGSDEKPVGTVWIAVRFRNQLSVKRFQFSRNRENNILRASNTSILMLIELIKSF